MRVELEVALGLAGELEVVELGAPVMALGERRAGQVQEPGLLGPVMEPDQGHGQIGRAEPRPAIQGLAPGHLFDLAAALQQRGEIPIGKSLTDVLAINSRIAAQYQ